jgi:hypothetical protein
VCRVADLLKFAMSYFKSVEVKTDPEQKKIKEYGFQKLEELTSLGNQVSIELVLECLAHPYQFVRIETINRVKNFRRKDFTWIFAMALNDECDFVVEESSDALAKINSDEALQILSNAFFEDFIERPHHIASAISQFGRQGYEILFGGTKSNSPNIRYYSAKLLGSTGFESAKFRLEEMVKEDNEKTSFGGLVSTAAKRGLKTLSKKLENET